MLEKFATDKILPNEPNHLTFRLEVQTHSTKRMQNTRIDWVVCHRKPERSFFWRGKQFPLCARCTGINVGYIALPIFTFNWVVWPFWMAFVLMLPTAIDGYTQAYFNRESTNPLRFATGFLAGVGLMELAADIGKTIGRWILMLF